MKVSCANPMLDSVITFLAPLQIYKPDGSIGHDARLHRDCVDIAAKLSLGFNSNALSYMLAKDDMKSHPVIVAISNINEVDPAFSGGTLAVRIKQTSDHAAVMHFKKLEDDIFRDLKLLRTIKEEAWKRKDTYDEVLKAALGQTNYGEFVAIKDSKLSAISKFQWIVDQEESLEAEYSSILSGASDPSCFTSLYDYHNYRCCANSTRRGLDIYFIDFSSPNLAFLNE